MILSAEQVAEDTQDLVGEDNIKAINELYIAQDDSDLYPVLGKFNITEKAIEHIEKMDCPMYGLEYCYCLEHEMSLIVNDPNW